MHWVARNSCHDIFQHRKRQRPQWRKGRSDNKWKVKLMPRQSHHANLPQVVSADGDRTRPEEILNMFADPMSWTCKDQHMHITVGPCDCALADGNLRGQAHGNVGHSNRVITKFNVHGHRVSLVSCMYHKDAQKYSSLPRYSNKSPSPETSVFQIQSLRLSENEEHRSMSSRTNLQYWVRTKRRLYIEECDGNSN